MVAWRQLNLELEQDNFLDSEDLWKVDLRSSSFKTDERKGVLKVEKMACVKDLELSHGSYASFILKP